MFSALKRVFCPLDTRAADAAIAEANAQQRQVRVRARALRMDINCGATGERLEAIMSQFTRRAGVVLRDIYPAAPGPLPEPMQQLLERL